jgi:Ca2+-binding EF-hand superfamily protein
LILDEDMEGNITLQEYYDALEAYNCEGEEHLPIDGSNYHVEFAMKAVFKLVMIMKERKMSHIELFRTCDVSGDGIVDTRELGSVLGSLSPEFGIKDCYSLHNFFDIDKNGECDEPEFIE